MKDVDVSTPPVTVHDLGPPIMLVGVLVMVQVVSAALKPLPEMSTVPPTDTKVGLSVIKGVGEVIVNMAEAASVLLPVAVMV